MNEGGPGVGYAARQLWRMAFPAQTITPPAPGMRFEHDVPITVRDGVMLRANVFRPEGSAKHPVIVNAHPYGKDVLPKKTPFGYLPLAQYRFMRQSEPIRFSAYTSWEAPDPSYWVPRGYAVVNLDLRGFGTSDGTGTLFSDEEAADYADVIEWAAAQPMVDGQDRPQRRFVSRDQPVEDCRLAAPAPCRHLPLGGLQRCLPRCR